MRELAKAHSGSLAQFAKKLGMTRQSLAQYVNGKSLPGNALQRKMRDLDIDVELLMTGRASTRLERNPDARFVDDERLKNIRGVMRTMLCVEGEYDAKLIAEKMEISVAALDALMRGETGLTVSFVIRLAETTHDIRFVKALLSGLEVEVGWVKRKDSE
jgi:transcriptional regulator with XRE-family HTH domain